MGKSKFTKSGVGKSTNSQIKLYELIHSMVIHEAQAQWDTTNIFLVANSVLAGFIGTNLDGKSHTAQFTAIFNALPLLGFGICILWLLSTIRTSNYYRFRMAQAAQREPKGWLIFDGDAAELARGKTITIQRNYLDKNGRNKSVDEKFSLKNFHLRNHSIPFLPFGVSNLTIIFLLVLLFIGFYLYVYWVISGAHIPTITLHSPYIPIPLSLLHR